MPFTYVSGNKGWSTNAYSVESRCQKRVKKPMKRVKANDPLALSRIGNKIRREGDLKGAFDYYTKAAKLGDVIAHYNLSILYGKGEGVERDLKKEVYHLEEAAIGGHDIARVNLGCYEGGIGRFDRMVKHFVIAAKLGDDGAFYRFCNSTIADNKRDTLLS